MRKSGSLGQYRFQFHGHTHVAVDLELAAHECAGWVGVARKDCLKGFRVGEVPIVFEDRQEGTSKMSGNIVYEALWVVWTLAIRNGFRRRPPKKVR